MKIDPKWRTWVEVDLDAIEANFNLFKKLAGGKSKLIAVVKSNAYGHDIIDVALKVEKLGADIIAVDEISEALLLREEGIKAPILVFGYTPKASFGDAAKNKIAITISNRESLEDALAFAKLKKLEIHIKADTGLHRQGFKAEDMNFVLKRVKLAKNLKVSGLYTHLASAESPGDKAYTTRQKDEFAVWIQAAMDAGLTPIAHMSASAATLLYDEMRLGAVRLGISLYGLWASKDVRSALPKIALRPALAWKAVVSEAKMVQSGESVGYDLSERVSKDSIIAIIPVGYWHGFPRSMSSKGEVLIKGKRAKVVGRVSMDMMAVDVTHIKGVGQGSEAVLIGKQGKEEITADEAAEKAGTISYEIITRINPQIPRITA